MLALMFPWQSKAFCLIYDNCIQQQDIMPLKPILLIDLIRYGMIYPSLIIFSKHIHTILLCCYFLQQMYYSFCAHNLQMSLATMLSLIYKIHLPPPPPLHINILSCFFFFLLSTFLHHFCTFYAKISFIYTCYNQCLH